MSRYLEAIGKNILDASFKVHSNLGPGLLESAYQFCLAYELNKMNISVEVEKALPLVYEDVRLDCGYRIDLLVAKQVIVEIKAVEILNPVHLAQVITYLKLTDLRLGYLINFNVPRLKKGIRRVVNQYE